MSRLARRTTGGEAGFTLLELLIAMALLGLIFTGLGAGLRFGTAAWHAGAARLKDSDDLQIVYRVLNRELTAALPIAEKNDKPDPATSFTGRADQVTFVGAAPAQGMPAGLYRFGVVLQRDGQANALTFQWQQLEGTGSGQEPLVRGVSSVRIEYLGDPGGKGDPGWVSEWKDMDDLPIAIRIRLIFADRSHPVWPPMIFPIPGKTI